MPQPWPAVGRTAVLIGGTDVAFHERATRSLDKLNATVAGSALLTALADRRAGIGGPARNVGLNHTDLGNDCAGIFGAGGAPSDGRTLLAQALIDGVGIIPDEITASLVAMGPRFTHAWLADAINMTPIYTLMGLPAATPSNFGLTAAHVQDWVNRVTNYPAPFLPAQQEDLTKLLLTVLWPGSSTRPGVGLHSRVNWNPTRNTVTLTTGEVLRGSKTVSLAHELTHALYNGEGKQLGAENGVYSTVLFEYTAVGLGPWASEPSSENKYRAEWTRPTLAQRPCY